MRKCNRNLFLCLAGLLFAGSLAAAAGAVTLKPGHPTQYTVQGGDTLWDISGRFLDAPWLWPEIWRANPQIKNPDLIYPGDVLELVYVDGRPYLRHRGGGAGGVVKLSPRIRSTPTVTAIPTVPMDAIGPFLSRPVVVDAEASLNAAPYVLAFPDERIAVGAGDRFYGRHVSSPVGSKFDIVRPAGDLLDGDTGEVLGFGAAFIGSASLQAPGEPATLVITRADREILPGDRLIAATEDEPFQNFHPKPPSVAVHGNIIAVIGGVAEIGQYNVVVLDRGSRDGIDAGTVLRVDRRGQIVRDRVAVEQKREVELIDDPVEGPPTVIDPVGLPKALRLDDREAGTFLGGAIASVGLGDFVALPEEQAGLLMVFRTSDRISVALVMKATRPIHVLDRIRNP
ncbi:MAG: LysM peptidoglycan-binding domain-containing protein [Gammaproteobacteria bacterium]|jgi:hypothetical protein|nr:LysM peptidoglycan-binding domain-containing protein [Gammaproteobacteria bacterium]